MTLSRQLILIISLMFVLIFSGTFFINVDKTRNYLAEQLQSHAEDTATSLGLSLSPHMASGDTIIMDSMVDAIFDRGYYRDLVVEDVQGKPIIERHLAVQIDGVPGWFVNLISLQTPLGEAYIMAGWKQGGRILIRSHPGFAYTELWNSVRQTFWWSLLSLTIAVLLVIVILRWLLRPLRQVEAQAVAITQREFPVVDEIPRTRELRSVVLAMNRMTSKVEQMLREQSELAERMRKDAHVDSVTELGNRRSFDMRLAHMLGSSEEVAYGAVILLRVADFNEVNTRLGYAVGDALLQGVAQAITTALAEDKNVFVARVGGSEFAVLAPGLAIDASEDMADSLVQAVGRVRLAELERFEFHIGIGYYTGRENAGELLAHTDMSLRAAQAKGANVWHRHDSGAEPGAAVYGAGQWKEMLDRVIDEGRIELRFQVSKTRDGEVFHYEVLSRILGQDGQLVPAGVFLPMAERGGLAASLDRVVVATVMDQIPRYDHIEARFAINLSPASIHDESFVDWLADALSAAPELAHRLSFEFSEYGALASLDALSSFLDRLRPLGVQVALDHFGTGSRSFGYLRSLHLDYIKVDGSYVRELKEHGDNQFYIQVLTELAHGLDITVVAEFVENAAIQEVLFSLKVDALQGYHIGGVETLTDEETTEINY